MKIILHANDYEGEDIELVLDDSEFDVAGWLSINIKDKSAEVHISQLLPALISFYKKYKIETMSSCCDAPMIGGAQCECCGADGREKL